LAAAVKAGVAHASVYPLSIEPDTALAQSLAAGVLPDIDEDMQAAQMELAAAVLADAGYQRYEVASYARPGFECQHNIAYWTGLGYLGLGSGAAGMRNTAVGRERLLSGEVDEVLSREQAAAEDIMLGMRLSRGVAAVDIDRAAELLPRLRQAIDELLALGLVKLDDGRYRPTSHGWLLGNQLYSRIWDCTTNALQ
jgi:oxygen-independent coproporphyrinogen-3 oxidase